MSSFIVTVQSASQTKNDNGLIPGQQAIGYPTKLGGISTNCAESMIYSLLCDGSLSTPNGFYSVAPNTPVIPFVPGTPNPNGISTTWSIQSDGTLNWNNTSFTDNEAIFCISPSTTTTSGLFAYLNGSVPADCTPITLGTMPCKSEYAQNGVALLMGSSE